MDENWIADRVRSLGARRFCNFVLLLFVLWLACLLYMNFDIWNMPKFTQSRWSLRYSPPHQAGIDKMGIPFNISKEAMASLGIPLHKLSVLDDVSVRDFVFVIGASANHFVESLDAVAGVQRHMPHYIIYFYDLGLEPDQIQQLRTYCHVRYTEFDFKKYPDHVTNLLNYAFKPLIIHEVLQIHPAVIWMDASFRLSGSLDPIYPQVIQTGGILTFWKSPHSNFAVTNPSMYQYLPTDVDQQKRTRSRGANSVYWHKTKKIYRDIIYWWVLCALDPECIAPRNADLHCKFKRGDPNNVYAHCHRFDQSAMNILISNLYGYDYNLYTVSSNDIVSVVKHATSTNELQICEN